MKPRDVERLLADLPVPPPPEGLAERIKDEIPDRLELAPELARDLPAGAPRQRRQWWLAAAAVLTVGLTATLTWQLRHDRPAMAPLESGAAGSRLASPGPADEVARGEIEAEAGTAYPRSVAASDGGEAETRIVADDEVESTQQPSMEEADAAAERKPSELRSRDQAGTRGAADSDERLTESNERRRLLVPRQIRGLATAKEPAAPTPEPVAKMRQVMPPAQPNDGTVSGHSTAPAPADEPEVRQDAAEYQLPGSPATLDAAGPSAALSTGGTTEPNDQPYGDVFFREHGVNPFIDTEDDRLSTFGLEVDTGSYNVVRRYLRDGHLPPREAVRVEELVNSFDYRDRPPERGDFALTVEGAPAPFADGERYYLLRFAAKVREVAAADRPPALLVFVVDTSGSMAREDRLGLVKRALGELLGELRPDDRVGLVVYGTRGKVLLDPTTDHEAIRSAIGWLQPAGSTNAEDGLVLGYRLAEEHFDPEGITRVILCSDGVANVGRTGPEGLLERIRASADRGIELTAVGFGMGNYNDVLMERLADTGNGRYAYVDALPEARRIFVDELTGTLMTVAREAKAQVEFNPAVVSRYRLIGYENRDIADDRFRDPTVDAGEIGAGHTVTALYEIKLHEPAGGRRAGDTLATLRVRYRRPGDPQPVELEQVLRRRDLAAEWRDASPSLRLASLVAEFAEILKGAYWARTGDLREVLRQAQLLSPEFAGDARVADFVSLVAAAAQLSEQRVTGREESFQTPN